MKLTIIVIFLAGIVFSVNAQNVKFTKKDDFKTLVKGDLVKIDTDTAYIVSEGKIIEYGPPEKIVQSEIARNVYLGDGFNM